MKLLPTVFHLPAKLSAPLPSLPLPLSISVSLFSYHSVCMRAFLFACSLAGLPGSTGIRLGGCPTPTRRLVVVVVVVVGGQDTLSELLLPSVDVRVQLVAVLANRELLIVVDGDVDAARAHWLILRVVELGDVGVAQGLICRQAPIRVELQQVAQ